MDAKVLIICGSQTDLKFLGGAEGFLKEMAINYNIRVASAHRTPELVRKIAKNAEKNGVEVIVAAAGWAAHLPGVIAAYTILPVIGVPLNTSPLNGIDSVMSILQMPKGVPVAAVAIGEAGVTNATILAAEILALKYPPVKKKLINWKKRLQSSANTSSKNKQ